MPDLDADQILAEAAKNPGPLRLEKVDPHTIRCQVGDISFVPLPWSGRRRRIAGLLTIELPIGVKAGQIFEVVVRQHTLRIGQIVGQFQLTIPVQLSEELRVPEMRWLNVMRSIGKTVLPHTRWHAIWHRYMALTARRVRALGGNPDNLPPEGYEGTEDGTPDGDSELERLREKLEECCRSVGRAGMLLAVAALLLAIAALIGSGSDRAGRFGAGVRRHRVLRVEALTLSRTRPSSHRFTIPEAEIAVGSE